MPFALVTGATAGIGAEFARQLAAEGHDLVLVARDSGRLGERAAELRDAYGVVVEILAADLVSAPSLELVEARVASSTDPIDYLVNNAGFGLRGEFEDTDIDDEQRLLDLLVAVPMRLSHAALQQMLPRQSGTILSVASVAGFVPRGTYGAAKAWVLSFTRSANIAYRRRGVTVSAVAPGFVRTEFHDRMEVSTAGIPRVMWLDAKTVVRIALRDAARGRAVSVPTVRYKVVVAASRMLPGRLAAAGRLRAR